MENTFDTIVIGGGPAGSTAAKKLAEAGKKIALIEDTWLGGTCVNVGCIPTKFLLAASSPLGAIKDQSKYKVLSGDIKLHFATLQKRKDRFIKGTSQSLTKCLQELGVTIFLGKGKIISNNKVEVEGEKKFTLEANDIILAVGSSSSSFPGLEPDGEAVVDSTMLLNLENIPESLLIVGAGAIGIEFSDFFSAMGTSVTIVEGMPQLVPTEDQDIAEELRKVLEKSGRKCVTGKKVKTLVSNNGQAVLTFADGETLIAEKALLAVGRTPNTSDLGVQAIGGTLDKRGFVAVNDFLQTAPHCYAVGDVNGKTLLAHAADHQAEWVARHILGEVSTGYTQGPIPSCIFGHTEIMRVGETEKEVLARGGTPLCSKTPMTLNPIAQAHAATSGFVKAVWDANHLVGIAAIGHSVSHLVTAAQLLVMHKHTPDTLHDFMFCHPTLDEALKLALLAPKEQTTL